MEMKAVVKTTDLGEDWFAVQWSDGSMTVQNPEKGQRIDLPASSVETLREAIKQAG